MQYELCIPVGCVPTTAVGGGGGGGRGGSTRRVCPDSPWADTPSPGQTPQWADTPLVDTNLHTTPLYHTPYTTTCIPTPPLYHILLPYHTHTPVYHTPSPATDRMNDTRLWKHYLPHTPYAVGKIRCTNHYWTFQFLHKSLPNSKFK